MLPRHQPGSTHPMDERIRRALAEGRTIDITTTGRARGQPRRIEMWYHNLDGTVYITGTPGKRDWYANMVAHPEFTLCTSRRTCRPTCRPAPPRSPTPTPAGPS